MEKIVVDTEASGFGIRLSPALPLNRPVSAPMMVVARIEMTSITIAW